MDLSWDAAVTELALMPRLALAAVLSALIGWEREAKGRPAGLRTHIIVGLSAAMIVTLGDVVVDRSADRPGTQLDPLRIIEAIIAAVSFIAAGTIFVAGAGKAQVHGLTTAASLLTTTIIALATG